MDPVILLAVGLGGSVILGLAVTSLVMESKRRDAMKAWAEQRGWRFDVKPAELPPEFLGFKLFTRAHGGTYHNVCTGSRDGLTLRVADYQYVTGSGKSRRVWNQTICLVVSPGRRAPHVFLRRQQALVDAFGKLLGGQDLDFDDDPGFSKAYVVQTAGGEAAARGFLAPGLREFLTRLAETNPEIEVDGEALLLHRGKRLSPEALDGLLTDVINLRRHWA